MQRKCSRCGEKYTLVKDEKFCPDCMKVMTLITRKKTTKTLRTYSVGYKLPTTEYQRLRAFFDEVNCSGIFDWIHPETHETLHVRFSDQLDFAANDYGVWTGTVKLQEA